MNKVYEYTYDIESGGLLLNDSPTGMSKEPRPVYAWELNLLGVDIFYHYVDQNDVPYMWAEAHRYYYRGVNIFYTKGGTLYEKPEIILVTKKDENDKEVPVLAEGMELLPVDIELMNQRNHDLMEVVEQKTVKKIWNIYKKYKSKTGKRRCVS